MIPFTGSESLWHLENRSFCTNICNFLQLSTLDDYLEFAQLFCRLLFHPSSLPNLLISAFQSSLLPAPEHHPHRHTFLSSHRLCWRSPVAWSPQLATCPSLLPPSQLFVHPDALNLMLWSSCLPLHQPCQLHLGKLTSTFCPQTVGICETLHSRKFCYPHPNGQRTGKACKADKVYTQHFFIEYFLQISCRTQACKTKSVFPSLITAEFCFLCKPEPQT